MAGKDIKKIKRFCRENRLLFAGACVSLLVIVAYSAFYNQIKLLSSGIRWFEILLQIAIGYIINLMFYITQIYLPSIKKSITIALHMSKQLDKIIKDMEDLFKIMGRTFTNADHRYVINREDFKLFNEFDLSKSVPVLSLATGENLSMREYLTRQFGFINEKILLLLRLHSEECSPELFTTLTNISSAELYELMFWILQNKNDKHKFVMQNCIYTEYYDLLCSLKEIRVSLVTE